jgi:hypothetical protein
LNRYIKAGNTISMNQRYPGSNKSGDICGVSPAYIGDISGISVKA